MRIHSCGNPSAQSSLRAQVKLGSNPTQVQTREDSQQADHKCKEMTGVVEWVRGER